MGEDWQNRTDCNPARAIRKRAFMVSFRGQDDLSPNDLQRDFSESPVTVCRRGQREHLWSKVLNDTPSGCLADSGVNEKRFCIG